MFFGFDTLAPALTAIRDIPRKEVCDQALVMNGHYLAMLTRDTPTNPPPWLVILGCEGNARHVGFRAGVCRHDAAALGGKELPAMNEHLAAVLHRAWYRPPHSHGFYTFISRVQEFRDAVVSHVHGPMAELFVSHGYGRAAWCEFDHIEPYPTGLTNIFDKVNDLLVERGAYFDRPLGTLAEKFYAGNPSYLNQIKLVKKIVDPQRILNPDQLLRGV
jgi:hypothetical protein